MSNVPDIQRMRAFYKGKRVFVTGHTGFKGSWMCLWLHQMGADVAGYALPPEHTPDSLYSLCNLSDNMRSHYGDVRDYDALYQVMAEYKPEMIFHMAAQALVLPSYKDPVGTYAANVMGTVHVLEAARKLGTAKAVVNITTDKCYENNESAEAFKETDPMGGYDPYSSSKAAAEIVSSAYRRSFLREEGIHMATVRAGNVIGGGDFSLHRLIPDMIRAAKKNEPVNLRHPGSVRPWQHVLDVLRGYLMLGQALYEKGEAYAEAFNLGPDESNVTVGTIADWLAEYMQAPLIVTKEKTSDAHEAANLNLDNSKAKNVLGWQPLYTTRQAVKSTARWYGDYLAGAGALDDVTRAQIDAYISP